MTTQIDNGLFTFQIPLPNNPLKWLNCYVIKGSPGGRDLVIDTGFRMEECRSALFSGLAELEVELSNADVLLTHLHSDHSGNAAALSAAGSRILMSEPDYRLIINGGWSDATDIYYREGMSPEVLADVQSKNPALLYAPEYFPAEMLCDGQLLRYGDYELKCILVPGHSLGNLCLYCQSKKLMFTSDHVLFDITPNITAWGGDRDVLGTYLKSLRKIYGYDVTLALPGHRSSGELTLKSRIEQLEKHHLARLDEAYSIVSAYPGMTAYEIAGRITWQIHAKNWEAFPAGQKWFAVGEAVAHLDYLANRSRIIRETDAQGVHRYSPA